MTAALIELLRSHDIQPSAQRVAIAEYVLDTDVHPAADEVWAVVKRRMPIVSRATVYNTLRLLVDKGLLCELVLADGKRVYDPNLERHHHFIDSDTGAIHDVPWDALRVSNVERLTNYEIEDYQVVLRGRPKGRRKSS